MSEMCLQAVLTSSAYVHALSTCTYVTDVLTKNYSPLVLNVALRIARRGVERFTLIGKRTRREHDINWARRAARKRDGNRCVKCGGEGRGQRQPMAEEHMWKSYDYRMAAKYLGLEVPIGHRVLVNEDNHMKPWLEVNHIEPRCGRGYGWGCHNHLSNLETLCHGCHVLVTREQKRARLTLTYRAIEVTTDRTHGKEVS